MVTFCEGVGFGTAETVAIFAELVLDIISAIGVGSAKGSQTTSSSGFVRGFSSFLFFGAGETSFAG
jgi:hypothetical protein